MKRKDWKTKKLKKNIYGKFFKRKRLFFLRKLFLRKNLVLEKKNLIQQYFFYNKLLKTLKNIKSKKYSNLNLNNSVSYDIFTPTFFYNKKIFNKFYILKKGLKDLNLSYIFINNYKKNYNKLNFDYKNNNIIIYNNKNVNIIPEENINVINFKFNNDKNLNFNSLGNDLNFFINFNLVLIQNIEIYKILVLLYLNKF